MNATGAGKGAGRGAGVVTESLAQYDGPRRVRLPVGEVSRRVAHAREVNRQADQEGDMPRLLRQWNAYEIGKRDRSAPKDEQRRKMHDTRNKDLKLLTAVCAEAFSAFDTNQIGPSDIALFVDQWEGRRMAEVYRSHLSKFFQWACRKGHRKDNPTREVTVEKSEARAVYMTHKQFNECREALLTGRDGKATQTGIMVQCYVDLLYLMYQRTTDIRLLKWSEIKEDGIHFVPSKTEGSSGADVLIPMTAAIRAVLARARGATKVDSIYVISTKRGEPYNASGLRTAWRRACFRAGHAGLILKDIRSKAATDAKLAGYQKKQLSVGLAQTAEKTTDTYIRVHETPTSEIIMSLPPKPAWKY